MESITQFVILGLLVKMSPVPGCIVSSSSGTFTGCSLVEAGASDTAAAPAITVVENTPMGLTFVLRMRR